MEQTTTDDLRAFERRLTEVITHMQPRAGRWRLVMLLNLTALVYFGYHWFIDATPFEVNMFFSFETVALFALLTLTGTHQKIFAPSIIAARCRYVLADYNMSCDDQGQLILKPRPTTPS